MKTRIPVRSMSANGKDFRDAASNGKKYRRWVGGVAVALSLTVGGLGMIEAQNAASVGSSDTKTVVAPESDKRVRIAFSDEAVLTGSLIRLGDIAQVTADDATLQSNLEALVVGRAPGVGQTLPYRANNLRLTLRRERKTLGLADGDFALDGATMTHVRVESQSIEPEMLLDQVRPWLTAQLIEKHGIERLEVEYVSPPRPLVIPTGEWTATPSMARFPSYLSPSMSVPVRISVDGEYAQTTNVALKLHPYATIPVAARTLHRQEALKIDDVEYVETDLTNLNGQTPISRLSEVFGIRATRDIREGEPLTNRNSELIPLIEQGDQVIVVLEAPRFRLQMVGKALEDGRHGETIRILNLGSEQEIRGVVTGQRRAKVALMIFAPRDEKQTAFANR